MCSDQSASNYLAIMLLFSFKIQTFFQVSLKATLSLSYFYTIHVLFISVCMLIKVPTFVDTNLAANVEVISLSELMKVVSLATEALQNLSEHLFFPLLIPAAGMYALENCLSIVMFLLLYVWVGQDSGSLLSLAAHIVQKTYVSA